MFFNLFEIQLHIYGAHNSIPKHLVGHIFNYRPVKHYDLIKPVDKRIRRGPWLNIPQRFQGQKTVRQA